MVPTRSRKEAIIEGVKEVLRLVVLSIPALAIQIISGDAALAGTYGTAILFFLRAADKYIHTNPAIDKNGLLPF